MPSECPELNETWEKKTKKQRVGFNERAKSEERIMRVSTMSILLSWLHMLHAYKMHYICLGNILHIYGTGLVVNINIVKHNFLCGTLSTFVSPLGTFLQNDTKNILEI